MGSLHHLNFCFFGILAFQQGYTWKRSLCSREYTINVKMWGICYNLLGEGFGDDWALLGRRHSAVLQSHTAVISSQRLHGIYHLYSWESCSLAQNGCTIATWCCGKNTGVDHGPNHGSAAQRGTPLGMSIGLPGLHVIVGDPEVVRPVMILHELGDTLQTCDVMS